MREYLHMTNTKVQIINCVIFLEECLHSICRKKTNIISANNKTYAEMRSKIGSREEDVTKNLTLVIALCLRICKSGLTEHGRQMSRMLLSLSLTSTDAFQRGNSHL